MTIVEVNIHQQEKASQFLRALWAETRLFDQNCTWIFSPRRDGKQKQVTFGILHLGTSHERVQIGITYKQRGGIKTIFFHQLDTSQGDVDLEKALQKFVGVAIKKYAHPSEFNVTGFLHSEHSFAIAPYSGDRYAIRYDQHHHNSILTIKVSAYDKLDALIEYEQHAHNILYLLSIETNIAFQLGKTEVVQSTEFPNLVQENVYFGHPDWLDGAPKKDGFLYISKEGADFIGWIAENAADSSEKTKFLLACRHFYASRLTNSEEVIVVLCMSALEVASNLEQMKVTYCPECRQPVYKISQRVIDLVSQYLPYHMIPFFKEAYQKRSKHLHEGAILTEHAFYRHGKNIPQLSNNSLSGCEVPSQVPIINLWEYTSYCLRNVLKGISI